MDFKASRGCQGTSSVSSGKDSDRRDFRWWYLILSLGWAWGQLMSFQLSGYKEQATFPDSLFYTFLSLGGSVIGFASIIRYCRRTKKRVSDQTRTLAVMAAVTGTGTLLRMMPAFADSALSYVGMLAAGICFAWILVVCGEMYVQPTLNNVIPLCGVSYIVACLLCHLLRLMPPEILAVGTALLPLLMTLLLAVSKKHWSCEKLPASMNQKTEVIFSKRFLVGLAIAYFAYRGIPYLLDTGTGSVALFSSAAMCAVIVAVALCLVFSHYSQKAHSDALMLYKIAILLFVMTSLLSTQFPDLTLLVYVAASAGVNVLAWALQSVAAQHAPSKANETFASMYLAFHIGGSAGIVVALVTGGNALAFSATTVSLLAMALAFFLTAHSVPSPNMRTVSRATEINVFSNKQDFEKRLDSIAQEYGLSAREREVFALWSTGHSAKQIQEKLFLSDSTVKTHIRHIYAKCDAHARESIVAILERGR